MQNIDPNLVQASYVINNKLELSVHGACQRCNLDRQMRSLSEVSAPAKEQSKKTYVASRVVTAQTNPQTELERNYLGSNVVQEVNPKFTMKRIDLARQRLCLLLKE